MRTHAIVLAAAVATAASLPLSLPAIVAQAPGPLNLIITLVVAALWLAVAVWCRGQRPALVLTAALLTALTLATAVTLLPFTPAHPALRLVLMLAQAPFYGFGYVTATAQQAFMLSACVCLLIVVMCGLMHWKERNRALDLAVFGSGRTLPDEPEHPVVDRMVFRRAGRIRR